MSKKPLDRDELAKLYARKMSRKERLKADADYLNNDITLTKAERRNIQKEKDLIIKELGKIDRSLKEYESKNAPADPGDESSGGNGEQAGSNPKPIKRSSINEARENGPRERTWASDHPTKRQLERLRDKKGLPPKREGDHER